MAKQDLTPLVIAAQRGNQQALSDLLSASYEALYFYAYQTVKNEDLAADITQESCLEIITTLNQLREPNAFVIWARRITYHQCTKYFRESREVTVEADEEGETIFDKLPDENEGVLPEQVQMDKEFKDTMQQLLSQLPPEQRAALMLYYYEKLSVSQIAQIQGVTEGTIKSRLNYGRKAVKAKVEDYEKKTGVRLHSIAPLPLLLLFLFGGEKQAVLQRCANLLAGIRQYLFGTIAAGAATAGAATAGVATTGTAAAAGAAAAGVGIGTKIVAGVVAAAVCIGGAIGGNALLQNLTSKVPVKLCGTWYGEQYTEGYTKDALTLQKDGSLEYHGYSYDLLFTEDGDDPDSDKDITLTFAVDSKEEPALVLDCYWDDSLDKPDYRIDVSPAYSNPDEAGTSPMPCVNDWDELRLHSDIPYFRSPVAYDAIFDNWMFVAIDDQAGSDFTLLPDHTFLYNGETYLWYLADAYRDELNQCEDYTIYILEYHERWHNDLSLASLPATTLRLFISRPFNGDYIAHLTDDYDPDYATVSAFYYATSQYQKYDAIALTPENVASYLYIENDPELKLEYDDNGQLLEFHYDKVINFRGDFAEASWAKGTWICKITEYDVYVDKNTHQITKSAPVNEYTSDVGTLESVSRYGNGFATGWSCPIEYAEETEDAYVFYYAEWTLVGAQSVEGVIFVPGSGESNNTLTTPPAEETTEPAGIIPAQFLTQWATFPDEDGITSYYTPNADGTVQLFGDTYYVTYADQSYLLLAQEPDVSVYESTRQLIFREDAFGIPALELQRLYPNQDKEPKTLDYFWRSIDLEQSQTVTLTDDNWELYIDHYLADNMSDARGDATFFSFQPFVLDGSWAEGSVLRYSYLIRDYQIDGQWYWENIPGYTYPSDQQIRMDDSIAEFQVSCIPDGVTVGRAVQAQYQGKTNTYYEQFSTLADIQNVTGTVYIPKGFDVSAWLSAND